MTDLSLASHSFKLQNISGGLPYDDGAFRDEPADPELEVRTIVIEQLDKGQMTPASLNLLSVSLRSFMRNHPSLQDPSIHYLRPQPIAIGASYAGKSKEALSVTRTLGDRILGLGAKKIELHYEMDEDRALLMSCNVADFSTGWRATYTFILISGDDLDEEDYDDLYNFCYEFRNEYQHGVSRMTAQPRGTRGFAIEVWRRPEVLLQVDVVGCLLRDMYEKLGIVIVVPR